MLNAILMILAMVLLLAAVIVAGFIAAVYIILALLWRAGMAIVRESIRANAARAARRARIEHEALTAKPVVRSAHDQSASRAWRRRGED